MNRDVCRRRHAPWRCSKCAVSVAVVAYVCQGEQQSEALQGSHGSGLLQVFAAVTQRPTGPLAQPSAVGEPKRDVRPAPGSAGSSRAATAGPASLFRKTFATTMDREELLKKRSRNDDAAEEVRVSVAAIIAQRSVWLVAGGCQAS